MEKLYIVIPAYNEEENIEQVINDWYPIVEKYNDNGESRLVIIDDGSKDSTFQKMQDLAKTRPLFFPITKPNAGHGATVLYGYNYALQNNADYIFQTDSDGQTLPSEFHEFWNQREQYDMVIGHRNHRKDGISRIFVTKVLKLVIWLCFREKVTDANTPFRLLKASTLQKYISLIPADFNLSNVILSVIYSKKKCSVKVIPITFRPRQGGVNSINLRRIFKIGQKAWGDFRQIQKNLKNN
jgi:glycosyltransferase involved in cell wall biosynthesis